MDLFSFDSNYRQQGYATIAGIDEAGRGPWAGPVVAAAVVLPPDCRIPGLNDSKKLSPARRERLFDEISRTALAVGVAAMSHDVIDSLNILQATYAAMRAALQQISPVPDLVLVDGCWVVPGLACRQVPVIGGDGKSAAIAAASIIAKVTRDRTMMQLAATYPEYQFDKHKGYGTPEHQAALRTYGPCPIHRKSFAPVRACLDEGRADG
jgi:ribonuclease HII